MYRIRSTSAARAQRQSRSLRSLRWAIALAACVCTAAASAHALLVRSQPAVNGIVTSGRIAIVLEFNTRIDKARSRVTVRSAQHAESVVVIDHDENPTRLSGQFLASASGKWILAWQVLGRDGHITRGEVPFAVIDRSEHR